MCRGQRGMGFTGAKEQQRRFCARSLLYSHGFAGPGM